MLGQWWHKAFGSNQQLTDFPQDLLHEKEPIVNTDWVTKNLRIDISGTLDKNK